MAAPTLKLKMQEQLPVVCQGHLKHLIDRDGGARQLALEWTGCLHRGAQKPAGKVEHEGADEPFEQTITPDIKECNQNLSHKAQFHHLTHRLVPNQLPNIFLQI